MLVWKDGKSRQFGKTLTIHLHTMDCSCCEGENSICTASNEGTLVGYVPLLAMLRHPSLSALMDMEVN